MGVYNNINSFGQTEWVVKYQRKYGRGINEVKGYFDNEVAAKQHVAKFNDCDYIIGAGKTGIIT